jgi:glutamate synthase (ferredoxin)
LIPEDIRNYYLDLSDPSLVTRLALVHQRFSTNTAPSWDLAQPFRFMCHNGEINTLRGNVSRMRAREELMKSEIFGDQIEA